MGKIVGTGPKPRTATQRVRAAVRPWRAYARPLPVVVILSPSVLIAPTDWFRAIALVAVIAAAWTVGYFDGRSAVSREVLLRDRRDDPAA